MKHDQTHWEECFTCLWCREQYESTRCGQCHDGDLWQGDCTLCDHWHNAKYHCTPCINGIQELFVFSPEAWTKMEKEHAKCTSN